MLKRRLIMLAVAALAGIAALLAVPSLNDAAAEASRVDPAWLAAAIALELASCLSFVAIFRRFFAVLAPVEARRLAWIEMASGALLPGGGIGSLAAGGVLLRRGGMPMREILEKSSGLFFLTSATNIVAMVGAGVLLAFGVGSGTHGFLVTLIPAVLGIAVAAAVVAIPRTRWRRVGRLRGLDPIVEGIRHAEGELTRPSWRLLGAIGYLGFDIAVLSLTCAAVGNPLGVPALVLAYIIGYLANSLPVPGGIGVLEGGLVGTLVLYGSPVMPATAAVLLYHAIAFWIPGVGGTLAYAMTVMTRPVGPRLPQVSRSCEGGLRSTLAKAPPEWASVTDCAAKPSSRAFAGAAREPPSGAA